MSGNFQALMTSPGVRCAQQVAYSVEVVGDIAAHYDAAIDRDDLSLARYMLDAFYVHVRLLADFLVRDTHARDISPQDFDVAWTTPETPAAQRLQVYWDTASKYVVHFGRPRVPENLEDLEAFRVGGELFRAIATDVLDVVGAFAASLGARASDWQAGSLIPDPVDDPMGWARRIRAEQVSILKSAVDRANNLLGMVEGAS